ncbi:uncharacterized protein LOC125757429 [Rhipicephalus sanguineus]|uniref:uncharacterized protein LOC125757429 n=1 Tax=Rhipicephalus sanguineus TaxID=34632 RepID=UPI0020C4149E|nr:uncharacterized protein LOC125757429 [Rhipicephalus sanguineus]
MDHPYSVAQTSPRKAVSEQKLLAASLLESTNQLHREVQELAARNTDLQDREKHLERKLAHMQAERLRAPQLPDTTKSQEMLADAKMLRFYTGFQSAQRYMLFIKFVEDGLSAYQDVTGQGIPCVMHMMDQVTLVLMRFRLNLPDQDLAYRFGTSLTSVSRIFSFWTEFLAAYLGRVPHWPSREIVKRFMPQVFKDTYPTTRVILDCTEIFIETPSDYTVQSATYSAYKGQNTAKGLVGISPNGMVTFVADLAPGRLSDKEITRCSGLYKKLEQGDSVMADRGFLIEDDLTELGVSLNIPPFMKGKSQLSLQDEQETRKIAKVRIHVERVIGQLKTFKVLKGPLTSWLVKFIRFISGLLNHRN